MVGGVVFLQRGNRGGSGDGGGDEWRGRSPALLRQQTQRPVPGGGRQRGLPVPGGREPQASRHLEEERRAAHHGIQVHTWKEQRHRWWGGVRRQPGKHVNLMQFK